MNKSRDINMARFLAGEMSTKEEIAFRREMEGSPQQLSELMDMEKTWKYYDHHPSDRNKDSVKAWDRLHERLEADGLLEDIQKATGERSLRPLLRIAATIVLILAIGIPALYFGVFQNNRDEGVYSSFAEKGVRTVDLPDGSRVFLNERAEITYHAAFDEERNVELEGEAFFEVMLDPVKPFTVHSGKVIVTVLGTSFNVKQSDRSPEVEVFVLTGKVRVSLENRAQFITLNPGEMGESENQEFTRSIQNDPNYLSWKTKDFKFVDAELMEVLRELEESYHVNIHADEALLQDMRITTSYSQQSIDAILETISTAFGLTVSNREDGYYLTN